MDQLPTEIENICSHNSKISIGEPSNAFYNIFHTPYSLPASYKDGLWKALKSDLDVEIGVDKLAEKLCHGQYGLNGLLRKWLEHAHGFKDWTLECDLGVASKLPEILAFMTRALKNPPTNASNPPSSSSGQLPPTLTTVSTPVKKSGSSSLPGQGPIPVAPTNTDSQAQAHLLSLTKRPLEDWKKESHILLHNSCVIFHTMVEMIAEQMFSSYRHTRLF